MHFSENKQINKNKKFHTNRTFPSAVVDSIHYVEKISLGVSAPLSTRLLKLCTNDPFNILMEVQIVV